MLENLSVILCQEFLCYGGVWKNEQCLHVKTLPTKAMSVNSVSTRTSPNIIKDS